MNIRKKEQKNKNIRKTQKTRSIYVYIIGNKQIMEYKLNASRKFNIGDETYVLKSDCCYFKKINGKYELVSYYVEGNPNPFKLNNVEDNVGLSETELDNYIGGDLFNILVECQEEDKKRYIIQLVSATLVIAIIQFLAPLLWS